MTAIMRYARKYQDQFVAKYGIKLGFMSIFAKSLRTSTAGKNLKSTPSSMVMICVFHDYVDISIAISTPTGLVVPPCT
jgi:2-oxoglutarate dehydrogenase E2 component (dihydrolipoamide succinyltransferase)